jgi:DNA polymerase III subunit delta'
MLNLIGQPQAIDLLKGAIAINRIAPAYLFMGANGIGKSLAAKIFIQLFFTKEIEKPEEIKAIKQRILDGNHPDLLWIEPTYLHNSKLLSAKEAAEAGVKKKAPPQIRLEQIRDISRFLSKPPLKTSRSIVVIEQAETMAEAAANALLKTLEEPGKGLLILLAPSPESLLPTLVSRCQRIPFYRLNENDMMQVFQQTENQEILNNKLILEIAQGSPGEAINAFNQIKNIPEEILTALKKPPKTNREALELAKKIDQNLDTEAQLWLVEYLQQLYWKNNRQKNIIEKLEKTRQYLLAFVQPRLVWEVTLLEITK